MKMDEVPGVDVMNLKGGASSWKWERCLPLYVHIVRAARQEHLLIPKCVVEDPYWVSLIPA